MIRELVITIADPRVNDARPTNISILHAGGRPTPGQIEAAIVDAARMIAAGSPDFPAFGSTEEAVAAARAPGATLSESSARPSLRPTALAAGYDPAALGEAPARPTRGARARDGGGSPGGVVSVKFEGEDTPTTPDGRRLYFDSDPRRPGFAWLHANPEPGRYFRIVQSPAGANEALLEGDPPLLGHRSMPEWPIEDALRLLNNAQQQWYELPHAPARNVMERLRRGLPPGRLESAFAPTLDPRYDVETPGRVPPRNAAWMSPLFGVPGDEIARDYADARQRQRDAPDRWDEEPRSGDDDVDSGGFGGRQGHAGEPAPAPMGFARGATGRIPLQQALPMLLRGATAPRSSAPPPHSVAGGFSPSALADVESGSMLGGRPHVSAPVLGSQAPAIVIPRALKSPSEELSFSDYLRSLPPQSR